VTRLDTSIADVTRSRRAFDFTLDRRVQGAAAAGTGHAPRALILTRPRWVVHATVMVGSSRATACLV